MKIEYREGDLLTAPERFVAHQTNKMAKMGSGVAKVLRDRYPEVFDVYYQAYLDQGNQLFMGQTIWTKKTDPHIVINLVGQEFYGPGDQLYTDYDALRKGMTEINEAAKRSQDDLEYANYIGGIMTSVVYPLIGCGLAGGSWKIVSGIIEETSKNYQPIVYLFDGKMPTT